MIRLLLLVIVVSCERQTASPEKAKTTTTAIASSIFAYINDKIELDCSLLNTSESGGGVNSTNSTNNLSWNLVLFKKDNILIQVNNKHFKLIVRNASDEGVYECGYYYLNQYAEFNYMLNAKWFVKVLTGEEESDDGPMNDSLKIYERNSKSYATMYSLVASVIVTILAIVGFLLVKELLRRRRMMKNEFEVIKQKENALEECQIDNKLLTIKTTIDEHEVVVCDEREGEE